MLTAPHHSSMTAGLVAALSPQGHVDFTPGRHAPVTIRHFLETA
jgi:hypothetical protein